MTESEQIKNLNEQTETFDDLRKTKKNQNDQSFNTKNFIKKMTSKKGQPDQKAQTKITAYMNVSNSTSYGGQKDQNNILSVTFNQQEQRIKQLQERMKQRDLQIQKIKRARQFDQKRYYQLFHSNRDQKKKARQAIAKSMLQAAELRRAQRRQINPKLGYFKEGYKYFVEGQILTSIKQKIKEKNEMIKQLEEQKKCKEYQKKQRAIFRIQFIQKEITGLQIQLRNSQSYVNLYKERLKLADKEATCEYATKKWPIVYENYQSLQLLGKGGFGEVYKCYDLQNNRTVALKVNHYNQDPAHQEEFIKHVQRQAQIMQKLNHPNIGKFIKLLQCSGNRVVFALEYCSGPQLSQYIKKNNYLQQKQAKQIIRQIFSALNYLSSLEQKVIHYDLKPSNIMFHNGLVKILDFGLCKSMGNQQSRIELTSQGIGTYWYLPPETFDEHCSPQITPKVDVWSAGVIFYQILFGKKPFGHGVSQDKIYNNGIILKAKKVQFPTDSPKKFKVSDLAKDFIRQCLAYNFEQRLSPSQAYQHEYFKK